ncbi:protein MICRORCHIDIA 6 [Vigna umbellata]|uniref:protein MICRORCHIDIA 6 n=1 Tax=Vigna umbellata TaxID=87088 RepID=UPI001F5E48C7|nr:protein MICRORCHIDIA 6 [Vigna umbellata]XP_047161076.1 protein MICRORCHIDIA 6 [Vigna umbellata]XP_047161077.1 protein MICRORCHIDIA 6 [Vigna umbellata]
MGPAEIVDLSSDDESETVCLKAVKLEGDFVTDKRYQSHTTRQDSEENLSSTGPSTGHSNSSVLEQGPSPVDDTGISYVSPIGAAPLCRQFWKAGNYDDRIGSKVTVQNAKSYLHVHPMFLHSNATSHKWAFGAIAELLDNAVDEIQSGATFVIVDKTSNPRDGSPALLIQDDGGGMDPEAMRRCMSFGFSDKKSQFAIGRYGNGFKTSTMRLGADAIVFSCHLNNRILTQSIGLLSYTYLTQTQLDRIVVPMVNYEFDTFTESLKVLNGNEHFMSNLSLLLRWSPYSSEADLLKQFDDIGPHGTKVIIYNLWCNDDGSLELDFDTDSKDIRIAGDIKRIDTLKAWKSINENHIANQFRYSLRVYLSILYLKIPARFQIMLRGQVVKLHNIADDLKYPQFVKYAPLIDGSATGTTLTVTTIGFLKEAPQVNIHGFNVYHKNRLILPFWQVVSYLDSRGRGVVGILQADFIEPTHNKQDFERTSLFQKLEVRLKQMTWEYWDTHCTLFGYKEKRKIKPGITSMQKPVVVEKPVVLNKRSSSLFNAEAYGNSFQCSKSLQRLDQGSQNKRKHTHEQVNLLDTQKLARTDIVTSVEFNQNKQTTATPAGPVEDQKNLHLIQQNEKLRAKCLEFEKTGEELNLKVANLKSKIQKAQDEYKRLLAEAKDLDVKEE